jgi:hypothetical protein
MDKKEWSIRYPKSWLTVEQASSVAQAWTRIAGFEATVEFNDDSVKVIFDSSKPVEKEDSKKQSN